MTMTGTTDGIAFDETEMAAKVSGRLLARAWLNVALACEHDDDGRPALYRAVHVEHYTNRGIRLISTDSYVLMRAWIPEAVDMEEPGVDEAPDDAFTALDLDWRGRGLLTHIRKLTKKSDALDVPMSVVVTDAWESDDGQLTLGADFAGRVLVLGSDQEHVALPLFDGSWATWRSIDADLVPKLKGNEVLVGPAILKKLAALAFVGPLSMRFTDKYLVRVHADGDGDSPAIDGAFMRVRPAAMEGDSDGGDE